MSTYCYVEIMPFPVLHGDEIMHNVMLWRAEKITGMFISPLVLYSHLNTAEVFSHQPAKYRISPWSKNNELGYTNELKYISIGKRGSVPLAYEPG